MRIDIWSDIVCPFCIIGKRHLEIALERFEHAEDVEVFWHSFELDPNAPAGHGETLVELVAGKYGISRDQAEASQQDIARRAEQVGLAFNWQEAKPGNTFDAHRLMHATWAAIKADPDVEEGSGIGPDSARGRVEEAFIKAYFTDGVNVSDPEAIKQVAMSVGLPEVEADRVLSGDAYAQEVRADEAWSRQLGISGVPFYLIDNQWAISGAQPPELMAQALEQVWERTQPAQLIDASAGLGLSADAGGAGSERSACGPDGC